MTLQKLSRLTDFQIIIDKLQKNAFDKKYIHDVYRFLRIKDNDDCYELGYADFKNQIADCNGALNSEYNRGWETALLEIIT